MHDLLVQLRREITGIWRFRWWALATAWVVCIGGWVAVYSMRDAYEARAKFYVETSSRLDRVMEGVRVREDTERQVNLVRQVMLGRPMLEQVAYETDLHLRADSEFGKESLIDGLQNKITLTGNNDRRNASRGIYTIAYSDVDRKMAISVVDTLLNSFMEDVIRGKQEGSEETINFLRSEIEKYESQLRQREQALADFKREHVGLLPGDATGGYFDRLQRDMDEVQALESLYRTALSRKQALERQLQGESPDIDGAGGGNGPVIDEPRNDLERRIVELETQLDALLLRYTDRHPDVLSIREQLDRLHERRRQELSGLGGADGSGANADNPVYQQLQINLNETEVELAGLESQISERRLQIADVRSKVDEVPQIEAELADLTRDYDQVKSTYDEMRALLEQENIALRQKAWDVVNFRLIDPPFAGFQATSPQRVMLLLFVLAGGLGAGAGVAWLVHMLRPVIFDARKLQELVGMPVLGTVSMTWLSRNVARRRAALGSFLAAGAFLMVAFVIIVIARVPAGEFVRNVIG